MLRSRIAALAIGISSVGTLAGCLEPMGDDEPGFSRYLLDAGSEVRSVSVDPGMNRKIDMNDGVSMLKAAPKSAWAQGRQVSYWDLGVGRASATPAYRLARCNADGTPDETRPVDHPLLIDALPGDADYSQMWAIYFVCVTPAYRGELVPSLSALSDLYELKKAREPEEPLAWSFGPVLQDGVVLDQAGPSISLKTAYLRNFAVQYGDFGANGAVVTSDGKRVTTPNVYELTRPGSTRVERVIFSSSAIDPEGRRAEGYAPIWTLVNVVITADADINSFKQESDVVTVNADKSLTKAGPTVVSVTTSTTRSSRPVQFPEESP